MQVIAEVRTFNPQPPLFDIFVSEIVCHKNECRKLLLRLYLNVALKGTK